MRWRVLGALATVVVVQALATGTSAVSTASAVVPKRALMYGDSLTYESRTAIAQRFAKKSGWSVTVRGVAMTAPCDWIGRFTTDLATIQPSVVGLVTAANSGVSACTMNPDGSPMAMGSPAFLDRYREALDSLFAAATASGAKVVFFAAPPFADPERDRAAREVTRIATDLAFDYHGVSIANSVRSSLLVGGHYGETKACLSGETAAMGCGPDGRIAIRTLPPLVDAGLHLCPTGLQPGTFGICAVYSSGEFRFARAVVNSLVAPPPPKLP